MQRKAEHKKEKLNAEEEPPRRTAPRVVYAAPKPLYHMRGWIDMENRESGSGWVVLVFVDRHTELHTAESAERVCCDCKRAGFIIDALTQDEQLQIFLRDQMERTGDLTDFCGEI